MFREIDVPAVAHLDRGVWYAVCCGMGRLIERFYNPLAETMQDRTGHSSNQGQGVLDRQSVALEIAAMAVVGLVLWYVSHRFEAFEAFYLWSRAHEEWQVDELVVAVAILTVAFTVFAYRRWRDYHLEIRRRERAEEELATLERLLSVCAGCHKIRDGEEWVRPERYAAGREGALISHGLCPDCLEETERAAGL